MGIKNKKLQIWVDAGLIRSDQAANIQAFEDGQKKGKFGRGMIGLSLFAILFGVLSIIGSNWYLIPDEVKIGVHVLLNLAVGAAAVMADRRGNDLWREGASLLFFGLTMTLIILIGQIYQLTGTTADAFLFWILVTLPFFLLTGHGYITAVPWMVAFLSMVTLVTVQMLQKLPDIEQKNILFFGMAALFPLALVAEGGLEKFRQWKPALSDIFMKTGLCLMAIFTTGSIIAWEYAMGTDLHNSIPVYYIAAITAAGLIGILVHTALYRCYKDAPVMKFGAVFAAVSLITLAIPFLYPVTGGAILSALVFIAYWMFIGWTGQVTGQLRLVSIAITFIAIRIYWIYIELFGSLMDTGIGLIAGGVVMLILIYAAKKLNTRMTGKGVVA